MILSKIEKDLIIDIREVIEKYYDKKLKHFGFKSDEEETEVNDKIDEIIDDMQDLIMEKDHELDYFLDEISAPKHSYMDEYNDMVKFIYREQL